MAMGGPRFVGEVPGTPLYKELTVAFVNATSWSSMLDHLAAKQAKRHHYDILFVQELARYEDRALQAQTQANRL